MGRKALYTPEEREEKRQETLRRYYKRNKEKLKAKSKEYYNKKKVKTVKINKEEYDRLKELEFKEEAMNNRISYGGLEIGDWS